MNIPDGSSEQLCGIISQEWSCLDKMLLAVGFKQEGVVCGCLPMYAGTREALSSFPVYSCLRVPRLRIRPIFILVDRRLSLSLMVMILSPGRVE